MNIFWIGDSRCKPLQQIDELSAKTDSEQQYIIDDIVGSAWFSSSALTKLEQLSPSNSEIIVMLGIYDCIDCCNWSAIEINDRVNSYIQTINTLVETSANNNFYICTVGPVNGDYSSSVAPDGIITAKKLNFKAI